MMASLKKINSLVRDTVHQPAFLRDTVQDSENGVPVGLNAKSKILAFPHRPFV